MSNENKTKTVLYGRLSYAHLFEPHAIDPSQDPKYSVSLIIDKADEKNVEKAKKAIQAAVEEGKNAKWRGKVPAKLKLPLRDGDEEREDREEYENAYFINMNTNQQPQVVLRFKDPKTGKPMEATEGDVYSGCHANVSVNFYAFDVNGNRGIAAGLGNVQKVKDGERFGGGSTAAEDFDFDDLEETDLGVDDDDIFA